MDIKVVVHLLDGQIIKGHTYDFFHNRPTFHLRPMLTGHDSPPVQIGMQDLKAVFFVKTFEGDHTYSEHKAFSPDNKAYGRKVAVTFKDGERLVGTCTACRTEDQGFFLYPADPASNNERVFCLSHAVTRLEDLKA